MMAKKKPARAQSVPVDAHKHVADTRHQHPHPRDAPTSPPTRAPPKTVLYPATRSLDPQLVWKGKDEQDARPLEVPAVPIYVQEKIHPQAIVEDLQGRRRRRASRADRPVRRLQRPGRLRRRSSSSTSTTSTGPTA